MCHYANLLLVLDLLSRFRQDPAHQSKICVFNSSTQHVQPPGYYKHSDHVIRSTNQIIGNPTQPTRHGAGCPRPVNLPYEYYTFSLTHSVDTIISLVFPTQAIL